MLIIEKGAKKGREYKQLVEFEKFNPNKPIIRLVEQNDFWNCYWTMDSVLRTYSNSSQDCILNISSGTKLLAMAAILCAFNWGVPAFQYDGERMVKLPVFCGVSLTERLNQQQTEILSIITNGMKWEKLKLMLEDRARFPKKANSDFNRLKKLELVKMEFENNEMKVYLTSIGVWLKEFFSK